MTASLNRWDIMTKQCKCGHHLRCHMRKGNHGPCRSGKFCLCLKFSQEAEALPRKGEA